MKSKAVYMRKYREKQKQKECSNKFCDKKGEYYEDGKTFCLVHYLLWGRDK